MLLTDRLLDALHILQAARRIDLSACMEPIHYNPEGDTMNYLSVMDHDHKWGPVTHSRLAGTPYRPCLTDPFCKAISLPIDDEVYDGRELW